MLKFFLLIEGTDQLALVQVKNLNSGYSANMLYNKTIQNSL
jgi:hypothetical protein